jgi:hypothetical protein
VRANPWQADHAHGLICGYIDEGARFCCVVASVQSFVSAFRSGARILCLAVTELKFKPLMMSILNSSVTINRAISKTSVCYGCLSYQDNAKCKQQIVDYINSNLVRATDC